MDDIILDNTPVEVEDTAPATYQAIGKEEIREAEQILQKYKQGKAVLEARIVENEQWYKLRHDEYLRGKNPGDPRPTSAWLFNCIANKHADAMDNYPEPNVLPREEGDKHDAEILTDILPVVLEQNDFEQTYSDMWWYKLKSGTGVLGVYWDSRKNNGLGDIDVRELDLLNLFWEPGITDIQKSRNLFTVELVDRDLIEENYPELKGKLSSPTVDTAKYIYDDTVDTTDKAAVIDWYYKVQRNGKDVLHYCKFCNGEVLYASENDPEYAERGFYDHGKYPVVFDTLFPVAGSPAGFGYIDVCNSPQLFVDKLDQVILKHAIMSARPRFWVRQNIAKNGTMYQQIQQLQQLVAAMSMRLDATQGTQYSGQVAQMIGQQQQETPQGNPANETSVNALGDALNDARNSTAGAARQRAAAVSTPRT